MRNRRVSATAGVRDGHQRRISGVRDGCIRTRACSLTAAHRGLTSSSSHRSSSSRSWHRCAAHRLSDSLLALSLPPSLLFAVPMTTEVATDAVSSPSVRWELLGHRASASNPPAVRNGAASAALSAMKATKVVPFPAGESGFLCTGDGGRRACGRLGPAFACVEWLPAKLLTLRRSPSNGSVKFPNQFGWLAIAAVLLRYCWKSPTVYLV